MHKGAAMYSDFGVISTCYNVQNKQSLNMPASVWGEDVPKLSR